MAATVRFPSHALIVALALAWSSPSVRCASALVSGSKRVTRTASAATTAAPQAHPRRKGPTRRPTPAASAPLPTSRHVWTAADLASLRSRGHVSVAGGDVSAPPPEASRSGPTAAAPQDTSSWRAGAERLRSSIASAQAGIAQIDAVDEQWRSLVLGTDGYEREAAHDLAEHQRQRAALEQRLTQAQGELAQLEEQARKSGVEPGALR